MRNSLDVKVLLIPRFFSAVLISLIMIGCQSKESSIFDRSISFDAAAEAVEMKQLVATDWQTLFFCQGNDYWLETYFSVTNEGLKVNFSGKPTEAIAVLGESQPMSDIFGEYSVQFNQVDSLFVLEPNERRIILPTFHGVYETQSDTLVMTLSGENWTECSSAISVPQQRRRELEDLLLKGDSAVEAMIKDSVPVQVVDGIVDNIVDELALEDSMQECDEAMLNWANEYLESPPESVFGPLNRSQINLMYEDKRFTDVFGETLADMTLEEGVKRARLLTYPKTCNLSATPNSEHWDALVRLTYPLANQASYGRDAVFIDIKAKRLREQWMQLSYVRLLGWSRSPQLDQGVRLKALNELEEFLPKIEADVWPLDIRPLTFQIENTRDQIMRAGFEGY